MLAVQRFLVLAATLPIFTFLASGCFIINPANPTPHPTTDLAAIIEHELTRVAEGRQTLPSPTPDVPALVTEELHSGPPISELVRRAKPALARIHTSAASGSGFVYSDRGLIATNAHVVDCCNTVTVWIDNRQYTGQVLGRDDRADLAVVQVTDHHHFETIPLETPSRTAIGDEIIALGYPLNLGSELTATKGIVSSERVISGYYFLQHDAPINPGNSGGPLINLDGRVVGINTSRYTDAEGIGFALSVDEIERRLDALAGIAAGPTATPWFTPEPTQAAQTPTNQPLTPTPRPPSYTPRPSPTRMPTEPPQPSSPTAYVKISVSSTHACAVRFDYQIFCWGTEKEGRTLVPSGRFTNVSTGSRHTCGIKLDQTIQCWGSNESFSGAVPNTDIVAKPSYIGQANPPSGLFTVIESHSNYNCAIGTDDKLQCWGAQAGSIDRNGNYRPPPEPKLPSAPVTAVSIGNHQACAVTKSNDVICWGSSAVQPPNGKYAKVSVGADHACAIKTDNKMVCWGLFGPTYESPSKPPNDDFYFVTAAHMFTCGIRSNFTIICWGNEGESGFDKSRHQYGQLKYPLGQIALVDANQHAACALRFDGTIACWGNQRWGITSPPTDY